MLRDPWELHPKIWPSKSSFFTYLRGQLRLIWSRYPAKLKWKQSKLVVPPKGYKGKAKKLGQCHYCGKWWPASSLEVDHVQFAGSCDSWETANEFLYKLLDCNGNWVLADKECHKIKSYQEKNPGMTFDEAALQKEVIHICKQPVADILLFCSDYGYEANILTNAAKRRLAVEEILRGVK